MRADTDHESFILKPSTIHGAGVGVFVLHDVAAETRMELFEEFLANYRQLEKKSK